MIIQCCYCHKIKDKDGKWVQEPEGFNRNEASHTFCNECGHRHCPEIYVICPGCSQPVPEDHKHCENCGTVIEKKE